MIEGLGLLGMRKEAGSYRTMRKYLNADKASELYDRLLSRAIGRRKHRRVTRALDAITDGTEPIPYKDIKRFENVSKTNDLNKIYNDPSTISVARGFKGPTPRTYADDWGTHYDPGRARRIVDHIGSTESIPGSIVADVLGLY